MAKFRKTTIVVEAIQWDGNSGTANEFIGERFGVDWNFKEGCNSIQISVADGEMTIDIGDWIIKGENGEFSYCKPNVFEQTYEPVD